MRARSLVDAFVEAGHHVTVVAPRPSYFLPESTSSPADDGDATRVMRTLLSLRGRGEGWVARIVSETTASLAALPPIWRRARECDLLYTSSPPLVFALAAAVAGRAAGASVVAEIRDVWPDVVVSSIGKHRGNAPSVKALKLLGEWMAKLLYLVADRVVAVTFGDAVQLRERGLHESKVILAPNGADEAAIAAGRARERTAPPDPTPHAPFRIAYAGRLGPAQRVSSLLEAASLLELPLSITIVGEGPELPVLREKARRIGSHEVEFRPPMPREEVLRLLLGQDAIYVPLASRDLERSVPSKLFEGAALGVPVILAATGESVDVLRLIGAGEAADPESPAAIAAAIRRLASDRRSSFARGLDARANVLKIFRRREIMASLVAELEQLATKTTSSRRE